MPHQFQVALVIFIAKERLLSTISPLRNVMKETRCHRNAESRRIPRRSAPADVPQQAAPACSKARRVDWHALRTETERLQMSDRLRIARPLPEGSPTRRQALAEERCEFTTFYDGLRMSPARSETRPQRVADDGIRFARCRTLYDKARCPLDEPSLLCTRSGSKGRCIGQGGVDAAGPSEPVVCCEHAEAHFRSIVRLPIQVEPVWRSNEGLSHDRSSAARSPTDVTDIRAARWRDRDEAGGRGSRRAWRTGSCSRPRSTPSTQRATARRARATRARCRT
jgi:hypothetical protein